MTSSRFHVHVKLFSREMPLEGKGAEQDRNGRKSERSNKGRRFRKSFHSWQVVVRQTLVPKSPSRIRRKYDHSRVLVFYIFRECLKGVR